MLRFQDLMERKLGDVGSPGQKVKDFEKKFIEGFRTVLHKQTFETLSF